MPDPLAYRRKHSLLLVQRLLSCRPDTSPLTVILDSLEQSGRPIVQECVARAKSNKVHIVFLAFETYDAPPGVDVFVAARHKDVPSLQKEVSAAIGSSVATLLIIDTLHTLMRQPVPIPTLLTSFSSKPGTSLLVTYHIDIPGPFQSSSDNAAQNPYAPSALSLLKQLSTTILTPSSLQHAHAAHTAQLRSLPEPSHGLSEGRDGALIGLGANGGGPRLEDAPAGLGHGVIIHIEHRRRSGRGITEKVFLATEDTGVESRALQPRQIILLDDHPGFSTPSLDIAGDDEDSPEKAATTFNLYLTKRQKEERADVVLPYYDAQREGEEGTASGGRILYQMGIEDAGDWDSEEDEL